MKIQNKLLLLAIASVVSTSIMPKYYNDLQPMNSSRRGVVRTYEQSSDVAMPLENKAAAEAAKVALTEAVQAVADATAEEAAAAQIESQPSLQEERPFAADLIFTDNAIFALPE